jgi:hypothetical protein
LTAADATATAGKSVLDVIIAEDAIERLAGYALRRSWGEALVVSR